MDRFRIRDIVKARTKARVRIRVKFNVSIRSRGGIIVRFRDC